MRAGTSRNTASASASSVARRRCTSRRTITHSSSGRCSQHRPHRLVAELDDRRVGERPRVGRCAARRRRAAARRRARPRSSTAITVSRPSPDWVAMAMRPSCDHVQLVGRVALAEQHLVARERRARSRLRPELVEHVLGRKCCEQLGGVEQSAFGTAPLPGARVAVALSGARSRCDESRSGTMTGPPSPSGTVPQSFREERHDVRRR